MIYIVLGTRAQLIKMAPVIREFERRRAQMRFLLTGQHSDTMADLIADFGLVTPPEIVYRGSEAAGLMSMARWMLACLWQLVWHRQKWFTNPDRLHDVVVVHGDTFSALLGGIAGRLLGLRVAHVESGLRSFNWRHPFPEELTRLAVFRLAHIAFCPGSWAASNLARYHHLEVVDTQQNTLLDAVRYALAVGGASDAATRYAVASVHRFENLHSGLRRNAIVRILLAVAQRLRVVMVLHPVTAAVLQRYGLLEVLRTAGVQLIPRMTYTRFLSLLAGASVVLTDGGSNQEELSYLGVPTALLREATERQEGLGRNILLAGYDERVAMNFIESQAVERRAMTELPTGSPSAIVADHLSWAS